MTFHVLARLPPASWLIATDVIFAISLGSRSDADLERRHAPASRRHLVRLEQVRRVALDSDSLPIL